jgi:hypothetical protein
VASGTEAHSLKGHGRPVKALASVAAPDGDLVVASGDADGGVFVWSVASGRSLARMTVHSLGIHALAFLALPGDTLLLAATDGYNGARLWNPLTGEELGAVAVGEAGWIGALGAVHRHRARHRARHDGSQRLRAGRLRRARAWDRPVGGAGRGTPVGPDGRRALRVTPRRGTRGHACQPVRGCPVDGGVRVPRRRPVRAAADRHEPGTGRGPLADPRL